MSVMWGALLPVRSRDCVRPTVESAGLRAHATGPRNGGGASPRTTRVVAPMIYAPDFESLVEVADGAATQDAGGRNDEQGHVRRAAQRGTRLEGGSHDTAASAADGQASAGHRPGGALERRAPVARHRGLG